MTEPKPTPHPDAVSQPYWAAAAQGTLKLQRCTKCGAIRHYPQLVCSTCYSLDVEWIQASGNGTVHSWTVAHHAFHPAFKADLPYTLLIVDLEEGPRAMGRLDPASTTKLRLGLPVRISFGDDHLPTFTPTFAQV